MSNCIAMRECQTPFEVKNFRSQKNFQLLFKTGFSHVSGFLDSLKRKKISEFQTNLSPGIAMRSQRQKLPLTCNQRRRTLPVRITWKGDRTTGVSLRVPVEVKNLVKKFFLVPVQLHFRSVLRHSVLGQDVTGAGRHWGNIPGAELRGAGGQWGRKFWGKKSGILIYNSNQPFFQSQLLKISTRYQWKFLLS